MSNINQSLNLGKNCEDLVYFVEDDYIHKPDAIEEMIYAYERISTQLGTELIMCPADYPYLYPVELFHCQKIDYLKFFQIF